MCQVLQTVSLPFSVRVQFSFSFIPFSLIHRNTTDPQINSRLYVLPFQTDLPLQLLLKCSVGGLVTTKQKSETVVRVEAHSQQFAILQLKPTQ